MNTSEPTTMSTDGDGPRAGEGVTDFIPRLQSSAAAVADAEGHLKLLRRQRNGLVIEAVDAGVSQRAVARALGVSQSRVITLLGTDPGLDD